MKRKILLTISYLIEAEQYDFWGNNGYLQEDVEKNLKKRFPQKMKLTDKLQAKREHLSHMIIDNPNANLLKCPICKQFMTDRTKPNPIESLRSSEAVEGILMCKSCAWQLEMDVKTHGIEYVLDKFRD